MQHRLVIVCKCGAHIPAGRMNQHITVHSE
jgi:hypothetical protein